jgi:DNA invertase Pin-like site-specific DNA recombinase
MPTAASSYCFVAESRHGHLPLVIFRERNSYKMARKSRKCIEPAELTEPTEPTVPQTAMPSYRIGAYVRLSAVDRKQKGDSIENQQAIISAFVAENPMLELTEIYIDNGVSGQTIERPAFQRMLADLEDGKINCCVTKDLSRLGRNAIDMGYYIEKYFPTHNIRYIAINDNYDSADSNTSGIVVSIKNMLNEAFALEIGRKIRATKQMNIHNGAFVGRIAPYGYLKNKTDCHKLVTDKYAAPIVRQIFEKAADGHSVTTITEWLNDCGVLPPRRYLHSIGLAAQKEAGGHIHWNKGTIYRILKNKIYVGDMVQGKSRTKEHLQVKLPESEWVITENTHEPIISRDLFEKTQITQSGIFYGSWLSSFPVQKSSG